jgi:hypothetical protein
MQKQFPYPAISSNSPKISEKFNWSDNTFLCLVRKKAIAASPEEWVRQHILFEMDQIGLNLGRVKLEHPIRSLDTVLRADIVYFDKNGQIKLMIECKAFHHKPDKIDLGQLAKYLRLSEISRGILTIGFRHWLLTEKNVTALSDLEVLKQLLVEKQ